MLVRNHALTPPESVTRIMHGNRNAVVLIARHGSRGAEVYRESARAKAANVGCESTVPSIALPPPARLGVCQFAAFTRSGRRR